MPSRPGLLLCPTVEIASAACALEETSVDDGDGALDDAVACVVRVTDVYSEASDDGVGEGGSVLVALILRTRS